MSGKYQMTLTREHNDKHKIKVLDYEKYGNEKSWVTYLADGKRLSISKRFEQDKDGVCYHSHKFDDGTEITFNF